MGGGLSSNGFGCRLGGSSISGSISVSTFSGVAYFSHDIAFSKITQNQIFSRATRNNLTGLEIVAGVSVSVRCGGDSGVVFGVSFDQRDESTQRRNQDSGHGPGHRESRVGSDAEPTEHCPLRVISFFQDPSQNGLNVVLVRSKLALTFSFSIIVVHNHCDPVLDHEIDSETEHIVES